MIETVTVTQAATTVVDVTVSQPGLTAVSVGPGNHGSTVISQLLSAGPVHAAVTVVDSPSIDLALSDQQITASAIFGTTSGTVAEGDHSHSGLVTNGNSHDHVGGDGAQVPVGGISATGTPSSSTYLRGDGTWSTPPGDIAGFPVQVQGLAPQDLLSFTGLQWTNVGQTTLTDGGNF